MIPGKAGNHLVNYGAYIRPWVTQSAEYTPAECNHAYVMCARPPQICGRTCPVPKWTQAHEYICSLPGIMLEDQIVRDLSGAVQHITRGTIPGKGIQVGKAPADQGCLLYGFAGQEQMCTPYEASDHPLKCQHIQTVQTGKVCLRCLCQV